MQLAYIDESGVEPNDGDFLVVAGVMLDGDRQLISTEWRLDAVMRKHIPETDWDEFYFRATDIWNNHGYFKDKEIWTWPKRRAMLLDLAALPAEAALFVSWGYVNWPSFMATCAGLDMPAADAKYVAHLYAFMECSIGIEEFMSIGPVAEIAMLIAENRPEVQKSLKRAHTMMRTPKFVAQHYPEGHAYLPFTRVREDILFAEKDGSKLLQVADVCAHFIRGHLSGRATSEEFYNAIEPRLLLHPKVRTFLEVKKREGASSADEKPT